MTFCPECSMILKPIDDEKGLENVCNNCGFSIAIEDYKSLHYTSEIEKKDSFKRFYDYVYAKEFPRTFQLKCENKKCPSIGDRNPEIIIISFPEKLETVRLCSVCEFYW